MVVQFLLFLYSVITDISASCLSIDSIIFFKTDFFPQCRIFHVRTLKYFSIGKEKKDNLDTS